MLIYGFEGIYVTTLAAWVASLGWKYQKKAAKSSIFALASPFIACALCHTAMRQFDYYESPLEKHLMWLGF